MKHLKSFSLTIATLLAIIFFAYSIIEYKKNVTESEGIFTCAEGRCFWTAHIHTLVRLNLCGKEILLPKLVGPLSGIHTHTEENILHWHDKLPADPKTHELLHTTPLTIDFGLKTVSIDMTSESLMEEKTGDLCPDGRPGTLKFFVNGNPLPPDPNYVWQDQDIIDIIFDGRTPEETLEYVKTLPKEFPAITGF